PSTARVRQPFRAANRRNGGVDGRFLTGCGGPRDRNPCQRGPPALRIARVGWSGPESSALSIDSSSARRGLARVCRPFLVPPPPPPIAPPAPVGEPDVPARRR